MIICAVAVASCSKQTISQYVGRVSNIYDVLIFFLALIAVKNIPAYFLFKLHLAISNYYWPGDHLLFTFCHHNKNLSFHVWI